MDRRDLDEIERFLTSVGRSTLFAYYGVEPTIALDALEDVVKKRRTWAQGQQSNPKYKSEALFLIKNNSLLRRVLLDQLDEYRSHVRDDSTGRNLDVLALFVRGTLASGTLTSQAEAAILHQGRQLELSDAAVARRIEELLVETGASRAEIDSDDVTAEATAIDHYAILGIATNAQPAAIEEAYRNRYRWARNLKDLKRASEVLQALDAAWRILSEPKRRVRYDERRLEMLEVTDEVEKRAAALIGLLGGPPDAITGEAPLPGASPSAVVHEVGFRSATAPPDTRVPRIEVRGAAAEARPPTRPAPAPPELRMALADTTGGIGRAPVPPSVSGRTIGIATGPQTVATLGPRLAVDGPEVVSMHVGGRPVERPLIIRNIGQGKMPGRVTSDRDWLKIRQPRLDPLAAEQRIVVSVLPNEMPWGRTAGTITVVTDHGERRTLTIQVNRRSFLPLLAGLAVVSAMFVFVVIAALLLRSPAPDTLLVLLVDPVADRVLVNGKPVGSGKRVEIPEPVAGKPFQLRVEADGFEPQDETVTLRAGEHTTRTLRLALAGDMQWTPAPDAKGIASDPDLTAAIQGSAGSLAPCFAGLGVPISEAVYTAWVTGDGQVRRVDITSANFAVDQAQGCVQRVFRGLRLPSFDGDYSAVEARLSVPVAQ
ncbi:MAG: DnaJ domain-containing protein [Pseudomonadota bacterium]|nr:DnaJ domain-containing protein [Pseudomonadota bacterium]